MNKPNLLISLMALFVSLAGSLIALYYQNTSAMLLMIGCTIASTLCTAYTAIDSE